MPSFTVTEVSDKVRSYDTDCGCGCGGRPKLPGSKWMQGHHLRTRFEDFFSERDGYGCWPWTGYTRNGYGRIKIDGKTRDAHRVAWERKFGPIPEGIHVLHRCDNPGCVRPSHLFLGTHQDNMADRDGKERAARLRGVANGNVKLSVADVSAIVRQRSSGVTYRELAESFDVSITTICRVVKGERRAE